MAKRPKTGFDKYFDSKMADAKFAAGYQRARAEIDTVDRIIRQLDEARLADQVSKFIDDATYRINSRFGLNLASPASSGDTNAVLTWHPLLYVYACLVSAFEYLNNGENAIYMDNKWETEADRVIINNPTSAIDMWTTFSVSSDPIPPSVKWSNS